MRGCATKACLITHVKACLPLYHRTGASRMVRRRNAPMTSQRPGKSSPQVTGARAAAQRDKLDAQAEASRSAEQEAPPKAKGKKEQKQLLAKRRANTRLERAIADYLADQEGGNHSAKTLEWHRTALGLLKSFLKEERAITLVGEVDAPDIDAWFVHLRKTPGGHGKTRSERTVQTHARSLLTRIFWMLGFLHHGLQSVQLVAEH